MKRKPIVYVLLGIAIGALTTGFMAQKAISNIVAAENSMFAVDPQEFNPAEAFKKYDNAKRYWPFYKESALVTKVRSNLTTKKTSQDVKITVFFRETAIDNEINDFAAQIKSTAGVKNVKLISKQDAFEKYKEQNQNDPLLLDVVTKDAFPASLEINIDASDKNLLSKLQEEGKSKPYVESVIVTNDMI